MVKEAVSQGLTGSTTGSELGDAYGALHEAVAREGIRPQGDHSPIRVALRECAAAAHRRGQPPERYLILIKACVRDAAAEVDVRLLDVLMSRVVTLAIAEYYRND